MAKETGKIDFSKIDISEIPPEILAAAIAENEKREKKKAEEEAARKASDRESKRNDHVYKRYHEIENSREKLFYEYQMTGRGVNIALFGYFGDSQWDYRFFVPENPVYKSVDNMIDKVFFAETSNKASLKQHMPFKVLFLNTVKGDEVREKLFTAYQNALKIYEYCEENGITVTKFANKFNPELGTMFDFEVEKFFKEKKKG